MKVLILAGGYGTRLYPLIQDTPKALLEIAGKTLIDHTLDKFQGIPGVDEVVVVTNAKFYEMLKGWALTRSDSPFSIRVVNDGTRTPDERLGAIGDILFVLGQEREPFDWVVVGSDNIFDYAITPFFDFVRQQNGASVSIGCYDLCSLQDASKYGVIELDLSGKIVSLEEKPAQPRSSLISMCLYYFPKATLGDVSTFIKETGKKDTTGGYIQWLYQRKDVYGLKFNGKWYDIGSLESYHEAEQQFSK